MPQFAGSINRYPGRASLLWYAVLILVGFAVLYLVPQCAADPNQPISLLDALFTSTSASCVTGLIVRSTASDFSLLGQFVILMLIQFGGIGIMTVTTLIVVQFNKRGGLRQRKAVADTLGASEREDMRGILLNVMLLTFICEAVGFAILCAYNHFYYEVYLNIGVWESRAEATWHALFHSISAFCNAGFALNENSLMPFDTSWVVNGVIIALIIIGGLGFPVVTDLWRTRGRPWKERWGSLQLHSKIMLIGTVGLLLLGFISFLTLEADNILSGAPIGERIVKAAMHSASCRTAGFNTVDIGDLTNASLFITIVLMMIGAGPCSTAGGFKVTTATIIALRAWATFQGYVRINLFRRTLPTASVERAVATALLFLVAAGVALTTLLLIEQSSTSHQSSQGLFLETLFEVISALGTVGLSTGLTGDLSNLSRLVVIFLMLLGRLGPITTFAALSHTERIERIEYPNEEPLVG